ncbi:MAG: ribosome biogenesis GTPase Der [Chlamydiales bacterium]|nr:ribosome biogenesis GTPase Der [Chlamydiales bacterium]
MTRLLKVALVGRPNVGKSALFNRICKKKIAIVDEAEGITRDRLYTSADFFGMPFTLIDTGGIDAKSKAEFNEEVKQQAEIAIEEADVLIMIVDAQIGNTALDKEVAEILLRTQKPLYLAINKVDDACHESSMHEFYSLGIKKMIGVSATQGRNIAELLEAAFSTFPKDSFEEIQDSSIKIAIIGRPNVGKSTLVNFLLGDNHRCIVSPIAGTTRDSIDVKLIHDDTEYTLIDTAGIRRKQKEHEVVDKFAFIRTERAIERADVCLFLLDATQGMTAQEKHIAKMVEEKGKGCVLFFNKWDLVKGFRMEHCLQGIQQEAAFLSHCPTVFGSANTGRNVFKLLSLAKEVYEAGKERINTPKLNKFIELTLQKNHPPMLQGKRLRIYYMVQVDTQPPTFVLFLNYANLMLDSYKKFLLNQFRLSFNFKGNPIVFHLKNKVRKETREPLNEHPRRETTFEYTSEDLGDEFEYDEEPIHDLEYES